MASKILRPLMFKEEISNIIYHVVVDVASVFRNEKSCMESYILSRSNIRCSSIKLIAVFIKHS